MLQTPVCLIIFNRPDTTARVFAEIAKAKPHKLFVIADGPRPDRPGEAEKCAAARSVIERVNWDCEVFKNYSDVNLGCGKRPATGITWVFEQVEEAIILEDDCVPHPTFFQYCEELLEKYQDDERVMCISGLNLESDLKARPYSYRFSRLNLCWGWASWRRAWEHFDMALKLWPALRESSWLQDVLEDQRAVELYKKEFDRAYKRAGEVDYWDYQWTFACWAHHGLSLLPSTALISNIGFGQEATHTKALTDRRAYLPTQQIPFPFQHPPVVIRDREADQCLIRQILLFNQPQGISSYTWLQRKCSDVMVNHPSLKNLRPLQKRLREKSSALVAGWLRKLLTSF